MLYDPGPSVNLLTDLKSSNDLLTDVNFAVFPAFPQGETVEDCFTSSEVQPEYVLSFLAQDCANKQIIQFWDLSKFSRTLGLLHYP